MTAACGQRDWPRSPGSRWPSVERASAPQQPAECARNARSATKSSPQAPVPVARASGGPECRAQARRLRTAPPHLGCLEGAATRESQEGRRRGQAQGDAAGFVPLGGIKQGSLGLALLTATMSHPVACLPTLAPSCGSSSELSILGEAAASQGEWGPVPRSPLSGRASRSPLHPRQVPAKQARPRAPLEASRVVPSCWGVDRAPLNPAPLLYASDGSPRGCADTQESQGPQGASSGEEGAPQGSDPAQLQPPTWPPPSVTVKAPDHMHPTRKPTLRRDRKEGSSWRGLGIPVCLEDSGAGSCPFAGPALCSILGGLGVPRVRVCLCVSACRCSPCWGLVLDLWVGWWRQQHRPAEPDPGTRRQVVVPSWCSAECSGSHAGRAVWVFVWFFFLEG